MVNKQLTSIYFLLQFKQQVLNSTRKGYTRCVWLLCPGSGRFLNNPEGGYIIYADEGLWWFGSRDGAVVRALASHQCGPGSIPGLGVICGLSLLLVLIPAPRVFLRVLRFSSLHKNQHFQIPIWPGNSGEKSHTVDSTEIPIYFILFIIIFSLSCFERPLSPSPTRWCSKYIFFWHPLMR